MWHKVSSLAVSFLLFAGSSAWANFRISAGLGLGSTSTTNEVSQSEGPLVEGFNIDYAVNSRLLIGAEHVRSLNLSPMSTAISFTGLLGRYYLNAAPTPYSTGDDIQTTEIIIHDYCYFVGVGIGMGQSNLLPNAEDLSSNAAGVYISPRAGMEFSFTRRTGFRGEFLLISSIFGKGTLSSMSLMGSVFYSF